MEKISEVLLGYLIKHLEIEKEAYMIYKFGFIAMLELLSTLGVCLLISCFSRTLMEAIIFFSVFIPTRSYMGGFHLEKFFHCFLLSSIVFGFTLCFSIKIFVQEEISTATILFLLFISKKIAMMRNEKLSYKDKTYFRKKSNQVVCYNLLLLLLFLSLNINRYLNIQLIVMCVVCISLIFDYMKSISEES